MEAVKARHGTKDGQNGADWWLKYYAKLPKYYITEGKLVALGWKWGKFPDEFAPEKRQ